MTVDWKASARTLADPITTFFNLPGIVCPGSDPGGRRGQVDLNGSVVTGVQNLTFEMLGKIFAKIVILASATTGNDDLRVTPRKELCRSTVLAAVMR